MRHAVLIEAQIDSGSRRLEPRIICEVAPVICLRRDDLYVHTAPRGFAQPFVKRKSNVRTLDKNCSLGAVDQIDHTLEHCAITTSVQCQQFKISEDFSR